MASRLYAGLPTLMQTQAHRQCVLWVPVQFGLPIDWCGCGHQVDPSPQIPPRLRAISACATSGAMSQE
jgi:hypothetical protein